ncbi:MAG: aromatic ring-hydroxylating dioxygenase subunit alpha [Dongiaceae bacterium]
MSAQSSVSEIRDALAAIRGLGEAQARVMPSAFYTSEAFHLLEKEEIFRREWVCVGQIGEVSKPGDYFTTELLDEPLLVVRGDDNQIRVLSNVCRHRANMVAAGAGNAKGFVCSYHAWTYGRDGRLLAARLMDGVEGFDKANCPLHGFATEVWQGFIFVNLDGQAKPLAPRLAGLLPHIEAHRQEQRHLFYTAEETWQTNWKCLAENFVEGYHLSTAHKTTLHPYIPTALGVKIPGGEGYTAYRGGWTPESPQRGPFSPELTPVQYRSSFLFCVFPSFVVSYAPDITNYLCLRPKGTGEVAIRWGLTSYVKDLEPELRQSYIDLCYAFNPEDRARLETLWKGLQSRHYKPGPLAPANYEGTIWDFYQYMAGRLGSNRGPSAVQAAE